MITEEIAPETKLRHYFHEKMVCTVKYVRAGKIVAEWKDGESFEIYPMNYRDWNIERE